MSAPSGTTYMRLISPTPALERDAARRPRPAHSSSQPTRHVAVRRDHLVGRGVTRARDRRCGPPYDLVDHRRSARRAARGPAAGRTRRAGSRTRMRLSSRIAMARDWTDLFITDGAARAPPPPRAPPTRSPSAARLLQAPAREPLQDARGARRRGPGDAASRATLDEETWERLEEALIMADVGASTTAQVVGELEAGGDRRRARGRRGAQRAGSSSCSRTIARTGEDRIDLRHEADGDHGRRRQRHRQDDDDRQARLAPAARARPEGRARRRRHVPRRRRRAARRLGAARGLRDRHRAARARTPARSPSRRSARPRARRRRRDRRHRRAPAHAGRPDGRARQGPPRDRQAARRARRTRRCSPSTRRPARTGCARPSCSPRPCRSTASC